MKHKHPFKKSLSRQFAVLMAGFLAFFIAGSSLLLFFQSYLNSRFNADRDKLVYLEKRSVEINRAFNKAFFDVRGYLALDNESLLQSAQAQEAIIHNLSRQVKQAALTSEDNSMAHSIDDFSVYYFKETLPKVVKDVNLGRKDLVKKLAASTSTAKVNSFQNSLDQYQKNVNNRLDNRVKDLMASQRNLQVVFIIFMVIVLLAVYLILRIMFKSAGRPLAFLAESANEIAAGREAELSVVNREDEIGALSAAFKKMVLSLQDKEKDLLAQNEELSAQQDELHAQQDELQHTLDILRQNEMNLNRRNQLIHQISNSLDKEEVLRSIVKSMCQLISADKGIITLLDSSEYASFGVSDRGVSQFRENIYNGLNDRLLSSREIYTIKREQEPAEKGFHDEIFYIYDLYLPVISSENTVMAIMVFSRFGSPFLQEQRAEFTALAKQIGLSLEKINIYEKSEKDRRLNQDIIDSVQEGIQLLDQKGNIVQINRQLAERFFPKTEQEGLLWEKWTELFEAEVEDFPGFLAFLQNSLKCENQGENEGNSFTYRVKDNSQVIKVYCENVFHNRMKVGTVLVHRDITREFEIDKMKSEFVSTVSHELRTPLASVLGFTELLLNRTLKPERQKKYLTTIYQEAERLTSLINDFLDVQRMESGSQTYEMKYTEIDPILMKVIEHQKIGISSMIDIVLELDSVKKHAVFCDPGKIEQVFTNLLSNAVKYSPNGGRITVSVHQDLKKLVIEVKDEGLGIPEEAIDKLFQKFYRIDNSDRRKIGGTGLGLAIVNEIVKAHRGEISVESEYGRGSLFRVSLPLAAGESDTGEDGTHIESAKETIQVMLIEDDKSLAELLREELLQKGMNVRSFTNGEAALSALREHIPDAIVLDIMLEKGSIDGWTFMKTLKKNSAYTDIPIFVSSALEEKEKGISHGAKDYLIKPYKLSQLSSTIMKSLEENGTRGLIHIPEN
ncbi:ATP-binding protein [Peribacillus kribbensis]|uniref:ATP-binding protein n=1 Tax=Peribacillus kribbensis TaxID=356658 RepID=UPI000416B41F|nr:ATP-binding protein [Peribacillus kribbensis]